MVEKDERRNKGGLKQIEEQISKWPDNEGRLERHRAKRRYTARERIKPVSGSREF